MKIGIFSGSFNPIHIGHLVLGNYVVENCDIDEVWYLVSPQNPLKQNEELLDEKHRYAMVSLATQPYKKLIASDFEFSLERPTYTVTTLEKLKEAYPTYEFSLIIGADNWLNFSAWKDHDVILKNYPIIVYPRLGYRMVLSNKQRASVTVLESPIIEISSTYIRQTQKDGKCIMPYVTEQVYHYIMNNKLYK